MLNTKYLPFISLVVLFTLLLRDLPYFNVTFVGRIWILYLVILLVVVLTSLKFNYSLFLYATAVVFGIAFVFTILSIPLFTDAIGILIYFSLWVLLVHAMMTFMRQKA